MSGTVVIGAGPAGLLAAWFAARQGERVTVLAAGIGTTHVMPGWLGVLRGDGALLPALERRVSAHPEHPYALAGIPALAEGSAGLQELAGTAGLSYVGGLAENYRLPTALGAVAEAAFVPESFAAGDLRRVDAMLVAGPAGWRDFYPGLCAANLAARGFAAEGATFALPQIESSRFDATPPGLARLFDDAAVRAGIAADLRAKLNGAARLGLPAVIGLDRHAEAWRDLQERVGVPVFEIPTLPGSVPGLRLYRAFKAALQRAGVQLLLDMEARGAQHEARATEISVPGMARATKFRPEKVILASGGLYGGGIHSDRAGSLREAVFDLPLRMAGRREEWFEKRLLGADHPIHYAGVRVNSFMQPIDGEGRVQLENVRVAGRALAGCNPVIEGSTEGIWLATAWRAATA